MPLDDVLLNLPDWRVVRQTPTAWRRISGALVADVECFAEPPQLPPLTDAAALRATLSAQAQASQAALLECGVLSVAGLPTVRSVIKLRDPRPQRLGFIYSGSLLLLGRETFVVRVQCTEEALVGLREALVSAMNPQLDLPPPPDVLPNPRLQALRQAAPVLLHPADHPRYDALVPQHALAQVRYWLGYVSATLRLRAAAMVHSAPAG